MLVNKFLDSDFTAIRTIIIMKNLGIVKKATKNSNFQNVYPLVDDNK